MKDKDLIFKEKSKDKLKQKAKKRLDTTMIGALAAIEKHLGFLWGQDSDAELTPEQEKFDKIYEQLRTEILDKGNNQNRILAIEIDGFEVKQLMWNFLKEE